MAKGRALLGLRTENLPAACNSSYVTILIGPDGTSNKLQSHFSQKGRILMVKCLAWFSPTRLLRRAVSVPRGPALLPATGAAAQLYLQRPSRAWTGPDRQERGQEAEQAVR